MTVFERQYVRKQYFINSLHSFYFFPCFLYHFSVSVNNDFLNVAYCHERWAD